MATIVYQGLQTCLESQFNEPRTLRLKLASPKTQLSHSHTESKQLNSDLCMGGWSFLQNLDNNSKDTKEQEKVYVHPSTKKSSPKLSEKSLEMCTEDLGNETGSDTTESSIFSSSLNSNNLGDIPTRREFKSHNISGIKKVTPRDFPPPLTTLSGSESLEVMSQREDGRLVIKAIEKPSSRTKFHAERTEGRLRLCIFMDDYCSSDYESEDDEEIIDQYEEEEDDDDDDCDDDEDEFDEYCLKGAVDCDKDINVESEVGMEKFQRLSRCKERQLGNKMFLNWEPYCVATS